MRERRLEVGAHGGLARAPQRGVGVVLVGALAASGCAAAPATYRAPAGATSGGAPASVTVARGGEGDTEAADAAAVRSAPVPTMVRVPERRPVTQAVGGGAFGPPPPPQAPTSPVAPARVGAPGGLATPRAMPQVDTAGVVGREDLARDDHALGGAVTDLEGRIERDVSMLSATPRGECGAACRAASDICVAARELCGLLETMAGGTAEHPRCVRARSTCERAAREREGACPVCPSL